MKTLIVYDKKTGNISFTQSISDLDDVEYDSIIADVPENKRPLRVENGTCILGDSYEIEEQKRKTKEKLDGELNTTIKKLEDNEDFIKSKQNESLCLQAFIIDIKYQKLELLK